MCAKCELQEKLFRELSSKLGSIWDLMFDEDMAIVLVSDNIVLASSTGSKDHREKMLRKAAARLLDLADEGPSEKGELSADLDIETEIHDLLSGKGDK